MSGIVALIFLVFGLTGIAYGIGAGTFKNDGDVMRGMGKAMETLGLYIVLVLFEAQFVAFLNWTNLVLIFAVNGEDVLVSENIRANLLFITLLFITSFINLH